MNSSRSKSVNFFMVVLLLLAFLPSHSAQATSVNSSPAILQGLFSAVMETTSNPFTANARGYHARSGGLDFTLDVSGLQAADPAWGISLSGFGRGNRVDAVSAAEMTQTDSGLEYRRAELTEWVRDSALGLEQGFTIHASPPGRGRLVLRLDLYTDLEADLDEDGRGLSFRGADGATIRYDHLRAWDADGVELEARLRYAPGQALIEVRDAGARYPVTIDPLIYLERKVVALDGTASDQFGESVALFGETAIVGVPGEDIGASGGQQGAAYVYVRSGPTTWFQQAKLTAIHGEAGDEFGKSVALSGDTAIIGAEKDDTGLNIDRGSAYVFIRNGTTWTQQAKLFAPDGTSNDQFGISVSISGDTALVAAQGDTIGANTIQGSAYVFTRSGAAWTFQQKLTAPDGAQGDAFGFSVSVSAETALIGAPFANVGSNPNQGAAYVFTRSGTIWTFQQKLTAAGFPAPDSDDKFGTSVSLSGDTALVGAPLHDLPALKNDAGSAYVFKRSGTTWTQQQKLNASTLAAGDRFGHSVALSGDMALIGALLDNVGTSADQGSAYIFYRNGTTWTQHANLKASDGAAIDHFGVAVAVSGGFAMASANLHNPNGVDNQGAAYIYEAFRNDTDLQLTASRNPTTDPLHIGDPVNFTTTIKNNGPNTATPSVLVDASLPAGFTYVSHTAVNGSYDPITGNWNLGTLNNLQTKSLVITATATSAPGKAVFFAPKIRNRDTNDANNQASLAINIFREISNNGGFNDYVVPSLIPKNWSDVNFGPSDGKNTSFKQEGSASVRIGGVSGLNKTLIQSLTLSGGANAKFELTFFVKGNSVPTTGICRAQVQLFSGATLVVTQNSDCPTGTFAFTQQFLSFAAPGAFDKVVIKLTYSDASGAVFFDNLHLFMAP